MTLGDQPFPNEHHGSRKLANFSFAPLRDTATSARFPILGRRDVSLPALVNGVVKLLESNPKAENGCQDC